MTSPENARMKLRRLGVDYARAQKDYQERPSPELVQRIVDLKKQIEALGGHAPLRGE